MTRNAITKGMIAMNRKGKKVANKPKAARKLPKLRPAFTPGRVVIMLGGRFRGRRAVFLKQLPSSGLCMVAGPYKINGVPLKRISQKFCIATSAKVDVSGVDVSAIDDTHFRKTKEDVKADARVAKEISEGRTEPLELRTPKEKLAQQEKLVSALVDRIKKDAVMTAYLKQPFSLQPNEFPHLMKW
mmetsp:Transcript_4618/g.10891  ORF Transcript_4618/g.10891 Transcript_4618/m.10891 type:complete len:186 (+) Transcript_4618:90-647(+)